MRHPSLLQGCRVKRVTFLANSSEPRPTVAVFCFDLANLLAPWRPPFGCPCARSTLKGDAEAMANEGICLHKLAPSIGAEVKGVDLTGHLVDAQIELVR